MPLAKRGRHSSSSSSSAATRSSSPHDDVADWLANVTVQKVTTWINNAKDEALRELARSKTQARA